MTRGKIFNIIGFSLGLVIVTLVTYLTALKLSLITGFPKGVDAYAHLTRIAWILTRFPQINWNPSWDSGTFFWLWSYPPVGPTASALLVKALGISAEASLTAVAFLCMLIFAVGLFATISLWAGSWAAIPLTLLAVTTPALWSWWGHGGNYIRIWGMAFYALSLALFSLYLKKPRRIVYVLLVLALGLSLTTHMLFTALTLATIGGLIVLSIKGIRQRIKLLLKTLGVGILLASFWYIPLFVSTSGGRFLEPSTGGAVSFSALFGIVPSEPYFSQPVYVTAFMLAIFACGVVFVFFKKRFSLHIWGVLLTFVVGLLGAFLYAFGRNYAWFPKSLSASGFAPFAAFPFIIIFTVLLAAGVLGGVFSKYKNSLITALISIGVSSGLIFSILNTDFSKYIVYDMTSDNQTQPYAITPVKNLDLTEDFRFGTDSAFVSDWFNYLYPNLPQTRDYIYQGIPYKNWQYFQEYSIWTQEGRYPETKWLMDWYGIKYFTVGFASGNTKYSKFASRPDLFEPIYSNPDLMYFIYEYKEAEPILITSDTPTVLVIGKRDDYDDFVRNAAYLGLTTNQLIPLYGGKDIAKYSISELKSFNSIFLDRYSPESKDNAIINLYLNEGGSILVDANYQEKPLTWPSWSPVTKSELTTVNDKWNFSGQEGVFKRINESDFSPPKYDDYGWKISYAYPAENSSILLKSNDRPVVLSKSIGKGKVIWLSLNLSYHARQFENEKETLLLMDLNGIEREISEPQEMLDPQNIQLMENEPQKRIWVVNRKSKGLVWKESWFPRWSIRYTGADNRKGVLSNFMAGPSLNYVPLPQDVKYPITISARFKLSLFDFLGLTISLMTLIIVFFFQTKLDKIKMINKWWNKEN